VRYRSLLLAGVVPLALAGHSLAAPSCTTPGTEPLCGDRIVAEPENAVSFHQFDGPAESLEASLTAMEALAPDFLEVKPLAEWTGDPEHQSFGGLPIWVVRVTDESAPREDKAQVAVSLSVHGLEAAGREGGLRYVEDLARWAKDDPDRLLYSGDHGVPYSEVMQRTETWIAFTNSDGWAAGDLDSGRVGFARGNGNTQGPVGALQPGKDLNRDFATVGWFDRSGGRGLAESEPEIAGWTALVREFPNLKTSTDIHGELTSPNDAFSDLIIPAGQWTPKRQEQVHQLGLNMIKTVERKFEEHGVQLHELAPYLPGGVVPSKPANVAAAYDIVGYDDSGFMGDWFSQERDSVHMDVENFLSNLAPNSVWVPELERAHVAAVRGNIEATIVEALVTDEVTPSADYGRVAYVDDPVRVRSDESYDLDGVPGTGSPVAEGESQVPYDVSRLDYYGTLRDAYGADVTAVSADAVATQDLSSYDTLVVTDLDALPHGATVSREAYLAGLDAFAKGGGQLVLTDRAVRLAADLGAVDASALTLNRTDAGHVDFLEPLGDHPYEEGLVGKPSQTYYEVMLGFPKRYSAPNWGVERGAWEAAGGTTVGTVGAQGSSASPNTVLGTMPWGAGQITVFGAVLPQPIERLVLEDGTVTETPHPHGLASYAVTITGGQVLDNVLSFRGVDRTAPPTVEEPTPPADGGNGGPGKGKGGDKAKGPKDPKGPKG
jgi:hypothetical protein